MFSVRKAYASFAALNTEFSGRPSMKADPTGRRYPLSRLVGRPPGAPRTSYGFSEQDFSCVERKALLVSGHYLRDATEGRFSAVIMLAEACLAIKFAVEHPGAAFHDAFAAVCACKGFHQPGAGRDRPHGVLHRIDLFQGERQQALRVFPVQGVALLLALWGCESVVAFVAGNFCACRCFF